MGQEVLEQATPGCADWLDEYWRSKREHLSLRRERTRQVESRLNGATRSELVHRAITSERNRFRLAHLTIKAARRFHVSTERMEVTISDSLRRIGSAKPERENAFVGACPALPASATEAQADCATEGQESPSNGPRYHFDNFHLSR